MVVGFESAVAGGETGGLGPGAVIDGMDVAVDVAARVVVGIEGTGTVVDVAVRADAGVDDEGVGESDGAGVAGVVRRVVDGAAVDVGVAPRVVVFVEGDGDAVTVEVAGFAVAGAVAAMAGVVLTGRVSASFGGATVAERSAVASAASVVAGSAIVSTLR